MAMSAAGRTLQDDLDALGWLNAEQTAQLMVWARQDSIRFSQVLATALLLGADQHLAIKDAAGQAVELLQGRVGRAIVQILEIGLSLKRTVGAGRTSSEERALIRIVASWLLGGRVETAPK